VRGDRQRRHRRERPEGVFALVGFVGFIGLGVWIIATSVALLQARMTA
jgi:hypothetical protein